QGISMVWVLLCPLQQDLWIEFSGRQPKAELVIKYFANATSRRGQKKGIQHYKRMHLKQRLQDVAVVLRRKVKALKVRPDLCTYRFGRFAAVLPRQADLDYCCQTEIPERLVLADIAAGEKR